MQRICQYQLLLGELLKATPEGHPHRNETTAALNLMQQVATIVNERRRQQESLERLALWQLAVDRWEGPNLLEKSSRFIYSGALNEVKPNGRISERDCFIFDHQLVYCKRTATRSLVFKGRIDLDNSRIVPLMDGSVSVQGGGNGNVIRNAWRIDVFAETLPEIVRSITFKAKSKEEKAEWMMALLKERKLLSASSSSYSENPPIESRQQAWQYAVRLYREQSSSDRQKQRNRAVSVDHSSSTAFPSFFGSSRQNELSRRQSQGQSSVPFTPDTLSASLANALGNTPINTRHGRSNEKSTFFGNNSSSAKRRSRSTIRAEDIVRVPGGGRMMVNCVQTDV